MKPMKKICMYVLTLALVLTMLPTVKLSAAAKKPKLSQSSITLKEGEKGKLKVKKNGFYKITKTSWKSKNKSIAKVGKNGTVTAVKHGKTKVTATVTAKKSQKSRVKKYKLTCKINVTAKDSSTDLTTETPIPSTTETPIPTDSNGDKTLVVYFSRAGHNYVSGGNYPSIEVGNTEVVAKKIIAKTGADEFKIVPTVAYPDDYLETVKLANDERDANARPTYVGDVADWGSYKNIFLGYPI